MKNAYTTFILLALFSLTACDKDTLYSEDFVLAIDFDFELITQACFAEKSLITLEIEEAEKYSYLWEINGAKGGHQQSPSICYCGTEAKVKVTRLSDGLAREKTIDLPACPFVNAEDK